MSLPSFDIFILPVANFNWVEKIIAQIRETSSSLPTTLSIVKRDNRSFQRGKNNSLKAPSVGCIIKVPRKFSFGQCIRKAFHHRHSPYIVIVEEDAVLKPLWLEDLYEKIRNKPLVAVVNQRKCWLFRRNIFRFTGFMEDVSEKQYFSTLKARAKQEGFIIPPAPKTSKNS